MLERDKERWGGEEEADAVEQRSIVLGLCRNSTGWLSRAIPVLAAEKQDLDPVSAADVNAEAILVEKQREGASL